MCSNVERYGDHENQNYQFTNSDLGLRRKKKKKGIFFSKAENCYIVLFYLQARLQLVI